MPILIEGIVSDDYGDGNGDLDGHEDVVEEVLEKAFFTSILAFNLSLSSI